MNITSQGGNLFDNSLQSTYVKPTQVAAEIAASENNKPQQVNPPTEAQKPGVKSPSDEVFTLPPVEFPADVPINAPVSVALSRSLADELSHFPDIDHAKVADVMKQLNSGKLAVSNNALAETMMSFYQRGR